MIHFPQDFWLSSTKASDPRLFNVPRRYNNMALPLCPPCGRTPFAGRRLRVVEYCEVSRFKAYTDITNQDIKDCPALAEITALDASYYLAEYGGMPGLVKGVSYGDGMTAYSENLKRFTQVCPSRVAGNKIKFGYGSDEIKEERCDCWEFCVKRIRVEVITPIQRQARVDFPFVLSRPQDTTCPICYDTLEGNVVKCQAGHQVCLKCFNLLPNQGIAPPMLKKCVLCNKPNYTNDEYDRIEQMNGSEIEFPAYIQIGLDGGNSFKQFCHSEALFLGMLKYSCNTGDFDIFRRMLISSLYNFYMNHKERFSKYEFNLMYQTSGNIRTFKQSDDVSPVIEEYINAIYQSYLSPEYKAIYNDIAYTELYMPGYEERDFNIDLEAIEKDNAWNRLKEYPGLDRKRILMREIYFRTKIANSNRNELKEYFKNILYRIMTISSRFGLFFEKSKLLLPPDGNVITE